MGTATPRGAAGPGYGGGREALVNAAISLGARIGVGRLTHRNVAEEAGVAHGLVLHHFGNLDGLLEDAFERCLEDTIALLDAPTDNPADFVNKIMTTVRADPGAQAFQYELMLEAGRRPELQQYVTRLDAAYRAAVGKSLKRLGLRNQKGLNAAVFAAIDGIVFQYVILATHSPASYESAVQGLTSLLKMAQASAKAAAPTGQLGK